MSKAVKSIGSALGMGGQAKVGAGAGMLKSATVDLKRQQELQKRQESFMTRLQDRAEGRTPSLAKAQLQSAQDRNLSQQVATARSGRGGNVGASQRNLARNQAQSGAQLAQAGAQQAIQERNQNEGTYLNQLSGLKSEDLAGRTAKANAAVGAGSALAGASNAANREARKGGEALMGGIGGLLMSDETKKKNIKAIPASGKTSEKKSNLDAVSKLSADLTKPEPYAGKKPEKQKDPSVRKSLGKAFLAAAGKKYDDRENQRKEANGPEKAGKALRELMTKKKEKSTTRKPASKKSIIQKAGEALTSSDETKKKNIKAPHKLDDFMSKIKAYSYDYKNPSAPGASAGNKVGVMAQDLEKSELGKQMVVDTPNGKMVDYGQGFGTILAAQSQLKEKLDKIEKMKKKGK